VTSTIILLEGASGAIDLLVEAPVGDEPKGIAWVGHPHPLFGGTRDNKVVQTMARALLALGYQVLRQNFRGVGASGGAFDHGAGETTDALQVLNWARTKQPNLPIVVTGFSFGSVVAANLVQTFSQNDEAKRDLNSASNLALIASPIIEHIVLVGTAVTRWTVPPVPQTSLIIHGAQDDVIPLAAVQAWADKHQLNLTVVESTGHFFHGQLNRLKNLMFDHWQRPDLRVEELS
jgi:uncharacterized protein